MSKNSIKAIDLYLKVIRRNDLLSTALPSEIERYTEKRDQALKKFRKALAKTTLEEFLNGRWNGASIEYRMREWNEMQAAAGCPLVSQAPAGALEEDCPEPSSLVHDIP
jgi:hypothetical protein